MFVASLFTFLFFLCVSLHLSVSLPSPPSPFYSHSSQPGRVALAAMRQVWPGLVPTAARAPSDLWLRLLYLGLQLPLIFWLQDTRPGLGQLGAKDVRQQGRQAAESRVPGGMCCRAAEPQ